MKFQICGFEHLHLHTDFSLLDGFGQVEEYATRAPQINQQYLCISDHGMMAAIPRQLRACEQMKIKAIHAVELYVNDKHTSKEILAGLSDEEKKECRKSYHLLAIAKNNEGYKNLVRLSSWGFLHGFYYKPRVTHEQLRKHKEGLIFTSCCYNGEIGQAFERGGEEAACRMLEYYLDMFGKENFYLELMLLDFSKQKPYDAWLIKAHEKYKIPLIITNDVHYCNKKDSRYQRYMLMIQTGRTEKEIQESIAGEDGADAFELQDSNLWMKSEDELNEKWLSRSKPSPDYPNGFSYSDIIPLELFEQAKRNTVEICRSTNVQIDRSLKLPQVPNADQKFREAVISGFKWRRLVGKRKYEYRLKHEFELICRKGFSSYFLIQKQIVDEARRICPELLGWGNGDEALGPGRGCLKFDTKIMLKDGLTKNICDVRVGDYVMTIDGTFQKVIATHEYPNKDEMVCIKSYYGDNQGVTLTPDHKVYVEKYRRPEKYHDQKRFLPVRGVFEWIRADQVEVGDWVFTPYMADLGRESTLKNPCYYDTPTMKADFFRLCHQGIMTKVRSVEKSPSVEKVYDLSVENNHNYMTTSFLVHNSCVGSLVCYVLGITDVDPVLHGLLFDRFLSETRGGRNMKIKFSKAA